MVRSIIQGIRHSFDFLKSPNHQHSFSLEKPISRLVMKTLAVKASSGTILRIGSLEFVTKPGGGLANQRPFQETLRAWYFKFTSA